MYQPSAGAASQAISSYRLNKADKFVKYLGQFALLEQWQTTVLEDNPGLLVVSCNDTA